MLLSAAVLGRLKPLAKFRFDPRIERFRRDKCPIYCRGHFNVASSLPVDETLIGNLLKQKGFILTNAGMSSFRKKAKPL